MEHFIELFVAHHCPTCPDARVRVREFADTYPNVIIIERNVDENADAAIAYGLFATPAIVVDGSKVLYGVPTIAQLAARCEAIESIRAEGGRQGKIELGRPDTGLTTVP